MGTLVEETKEVDMEMPEKEEKEEKEEKQTNSVSFEPQQQISPQLSEGDTIQQKEGESFRLEPISFSIPRRARRPRRLGEKTRHVVIERSIWDSSLEPIPIIPIHHRVRRPRTVQSDIPQPCEEELLEFEEDLREFIALRAARKKVQPNVVQTVRHPRTVQEDMLYKYLRVAKCYIEKYEHYASSYCPKR
ncbi:uncharacterized protein LOC115590270 isoform X2 [Sparus aurata]|uniref:uncharacterized protein LOC115590270 isoform X2 n=1 Tax=Sparus aurata TaxID=8175 RepID=UPI0011C1125E|nr:uncharacterized protein LOC115590270 isoform X2 [Sparus aurata]